MGEPTRERGTCTELHYMKSLSSDSGVPLARAELSVIKSSPQSATLKQPESTTMHSKALAEVLEVVEHLGSQQGELQLPPESCWDSSPIFVANKVASQHTWQAPRWIGKAKEGRIYYTHNSDAIHTQTQ